MESVTPTAPPALELPDLGLRDAAVSAGLAHGLTALGVCGAEPFEDTRRILEERRADGLHADMAFTYRNPARSTDPSRALAGARAMVVGAYRYDTAIAPAPERPAARVARYATADHYERLRVALTAVAQVLRDAGHRALVVADDNAMVDRAVATRAGLGFYGKNANVLLPGQGSWFVLGSVITDAELEPTGAPVEEACGSCTRCLSGCPTGAIVAPGVVDARRCLAWHLQAAGDFPREFRVALGDRIYGCDECQEVCPPSRRADARTATAEPVADLGPPGAWVDLEWLLRAGDDELLGELGRWYIARRDPTYLRRNALVVLGNTASPADPVVAELLAEYLDGPDELLAGHAAWAARRLGRDDLLAVPARRDRPAVAAELSAPAPEPAPSPGPAPPPTVPVRLDVPRRRPSDEDGAP
jgi:epoxyqueuosine reductase